MLLLVANAVVCHQFTAAGFVESGTPILSQLTEKSRSRLILSAILWIRKIELRVVANLRPFLSRRQWHHLILDQWHLHLTLILLDVDVDARQRVDLLVLVHHLLLPPAPLLFLLLVHLPELPL